MKRTVLFAAALAVALASCTQKEGEWAMVEKSASVDLVETMGNNTGVVGTVFTTTLSDLSEAEITGLLQMREEEKMAREVYLKMYELWENTVFQNIAKSELSHASAVLTLLNHFGIADPAAAEVGVFNDAAIQKLYNDLVSAGSESLLKALETGAFIEEYDILDLEKLLDSTSNADIKLVYGNLLKGSRNHLRAFVKQIVVAGDTYNPFLLTEEYFNEIINSEMETGKGNGQYGYRNAGKGQSGNSYQDCVNAGTGGLGSGTCDGTGVATGGNGKMNGKGNGRKG